MLRYSIVVCTYNRAAFLKETIESILFHCKRHSNYELLVVDNNSTDNTAEVVKEFLIMPQVRYVLEKEQGLSAARNRGIKEAQEPIIVFLDDDIDLDPNYLTVLDRIYSDPTINIVGGKVLPYRAKMPDWLPEPYYYLASVFDLGNETKFVPKLMGANHTFRREVAEKVGGYNVKIGPLGDFKLGGDENEFLYRAEQEGFKILYNPDLIVYHKIANRFNKEFVLKYAFNIGASEANIDFDRRKTRLALKSAKYLAESILNRVKFSGNEQSTFVDAINRELRRGYINFVRNAVKKRATQPS